jgi:hypothetical protein
VEFGRTFDKPVVCHDDETIDRDLRLDVCRGIALWFIFLNHIPDNVCSWLTLSHYGFSDATEIFMFVSGVTCALAYRFVQRCDGWWPVVSHTLRRGWEIHMAFLTLVIGLVVMVYWVGENPWADVTNTRILMEQPGAALAHAVVLLYRPVNTDVLPVFALFHLMFAPLLWLLMKAPNAAIAGSALLYGLVQHYGWNLPGWPINDWYFNPFAWQFLVVLGAWWVVAGRKRFRPLLATRFVVGVSALYLLFAMVIVLGWNIKPLEGLVPAFLAKLIYPIDKTDLDPLRLLHFLAVAVLVSRFVPSDWPGLMSPVLRGAIRCGENSLEIYCLGVMLSLAAHMLLAQGSDSLVAQIAVSVGGVMMLVGFATLSTWIGIASRRQPKLF